MKVLTKKNAFSCGIFLVLANAAPFFTSAQKGLNVSQNTLVKLNPVNFSQVTITDGFWAPRMNSVATATLQACIEYTENKTGRIRNFEKVARKKGEKHEGIYFDDSDVYKAIEAMAYSLRNHPDPAIEKKADEWIDKIAAAQLPDGYLNTFFTLTGLENRWTDMEKHEDYCAGHLIEAAIAYHDATGKRKLLDVAIRFADHIDSVFRRQDRHWVSGHEEIELALMKLYQHTSDKKYLQLAQWYLDQRGHGYGKGVIWDDWKDPAYCQDKVPVEDQTNITGHAVRAMYLYSGMADVAAVTDNQRYVDAIRKVWEDVVYRNLYITGGIGADARNEGFGAPYDLPNENAYCETCASVGMVLWNSRMNLLTGEAKYIDVLERSLYNGALDGLALSGDRFFYGNPLASTGSYTRKEWFGTACCPSNIARLIASLGNYIYCTSSNGLLVNLYIGNHTKVKIKGTDIDLQMETGFPWKGNVQFQVDPAHKQTFGLSLRIPGWLHEPVPGGLYTYKDQRDVHPAITVNGKPEPFKMDRGYAVLSRTWKKGDKVTVSFPMEVRRIASNPEIRQNTNRVALQYGPLLYCMEGVDNGTENNATGDKPSFQSNIWNSILPASSSFETQFNPQLLGGVNTIRFDVLAATISSDGKSVITTSRKATAIPYYSWANRGASPMQVWLPESFTDIKVNY
ncbi:glycoside hydrolase family 127 protein [Flavitalea flava]